MLLWIAFKNVLSADKETSKWLQTRLKQSHEIFDDLADLPHDDIWHFMQRKAKSV